MKIARKRASTALTLDQVGIGGTFLFLTHHETLYLRLSPRDDENADDNSQHLIFRYADLSTGRVYTEDRGGFAIRLVPGSFVEE